MVGVPDGELTPAAIREVVTVEDLAGLLRTLRRRDARDRADTQLSYRELAAKTGWAHGVIGDYFSGKTLPPTDRFDVLAGLLGATPAELGALATARDRVEEHRRRTQPGPARATAPRELPRDVPGFLGRAAELAGLDGLLRSEGTQAPIAAVCGTAGVGKTALAVHWAHKVAHRFPDGCLYVDLRGYGPDEPVRPEEALSRCLRSLGLAGDLPPGPAELAGRYRSAVADRRMLIVLDNARTADEVRPLLPGGTSSFVLVTSRDRLTGLVARDGAHRIDLGLMPSTDAEQLLRELIGRRAETEPAVTAMLAARCARLPLALRLAAELAAARPGLTLADLVTELGEQPRLDLFDAGGDPSTAVREIFGWSYRDLSAGAARAFRLLGLHPGGDFDSYAVAALTGTDLTEAAGTVAELVRAHLVEEPRRGRLVMHDLLRAYASEQAGEETGTPLARLFDHYLQTAAAAMDTLFPAERDRRPVMEITVRTPPVGTRDDARAWLDAELANLVAVAGHGPTAAERLSGTLWRYLDDSGHYLEALTVHGLACQTARDRGAAAAEAAALAELGQACSRLGRYDEALRHLRQARTIGAGTVTPAREAATLNTLAVVCVRLGRYDEALEHLHRALAIDRATGNRFAEGKVLGNLGILQARMGRIAEGLDYFDRALLAAREVADRHGEGDALNNLGLACGMLGRHHDALDHHGQALEIARELGDRAGTGRALANLGIVNTALGRHSPAIDCFTDALAIHRDTGDRAAQAEALSYLGRLEDRSQRYPAALGDFREALAIARDIGERGAELDALNGSARTLRAMRKLPAARDRHQTALALAEEIGDRLQQAHALDGLAHCAFTSGRQRAARDRWQAALAIYAELGVPEADEVRACLHALTGSESSKVVS